MNIKFSRPENAWYLEEHNTYFHIPFIRNSSDTFLKRIFRQDFNLYISDDDINNLRKPKSDDFTIELKDNE
jgi:hypothetical protein